MSDSNQSVEVDHTHIDQLIAQAQQQSLRNLDLSDQNLRSLPETVWQLKDLEVLDLRHNQLDNLPAELAQLRGLRRLDISNNQLRQLPVEIAQLHQLQVLILSHNNLTHIPAGVMHLPRLQVLNLRHNQLDELSPAISQLNLQELYLGGNDLQHLPIEMMSIAQLRCLDLGDNRLQQLPPEIVQLTEGMQQSTLTSLYLQGNDLPIPPEILSKTDKPSEIIHYYLQVTAQLENRQALNEAKVLIVGEGEVGKTSIAKRLIHDDYDEQENKTEGIHIERWQVPINDQQVRLNIWDFGGQEIMHATHQFFLTKRSLYLLVLDARRDENGNRIEYWLKLIQSFGADSPILIVVNKIDQQPLYLNQKGLQAKYNKIIDFVDVSCKTMQGFEQLKEAICGCIKTLPHVFDPFPETWFAIKRDLENMSQDFLPYPDYVKLCEQYHLDNRISQQTLIGFLHDLGVALNFYDDVRLQDTNILNPEWITSGVYKLLNSNQLFHNKGIFSRHDLTELLDQKRYPVSRHDFLIELMRKFELCFPFADGERYLIPELLPKEEPDLGWDEQTDVDLLAFEYHYDVLPNSVFSRFVVRLHALVSQQTYWRTGVVLAYDNNKALIKADLEDCFISIRIMGHPATRRVLLGVIRQHFEHIHSTIEQIKVDEKVPYQGVLIGYRHLLTLEQAGEAFFIPEGLSVKTSVRQLLEGIEPQAMRISHTGLNNPTDSEQTVQDSDHDTIHNTNNSPRKAITITALILATLIITQQFIIALPAALIQAVIVLLVIALVGLTVSYRGFLTTLLGGILTIVIVSGFAALNDGKLSEKSLLEMVKGALGKMSLLVGKSSKNTNGNQVHQQLSQMLSTFKVSNSERGVILLLNNVLFDTGQASLHTPAIQDLMQLAQFLRTNSQYKIRIEGHTDDLGDELDNQRLSERRAEAVQDILSIQGVSPTRISQQGYGKSQPLVSNQNAVGRSQNRRVEIIILPLVK